MAKLAAVVVLLLACLLLVHCQVLVDSPVPGKICVNPGPNFCAAVITPASKTVYLSGTLAAGATIQQQTRGVLNTLNGTLASLGSSLDAVVKSTVYLANISQFNDMNSVYRTFWKVAPPVRSTFEVAALASTTGLIEIDMIAVDDVFGEYDASVSTAST